MVNRLFSLLFSLFDRPLIMLAGLFGAMFFFGCGALTLPETPRGRAWAVVAMFVVGWVIWQITMIICRLTVDGRE